VWHRLAALEGLRKGRSPARDTAKVRPVPDSQVDAVLPLLSPQVRAMIELQRLTGARSGELCRMRTRDVDTSDKKLWVYRPEHHKTAHHDQVREIYLGPRARAILEPFLKPDLQAYLFSPAEAAEWHREQRRLRRKNPDAPQATRPPTKRHDATRRPGAHYTKGSYAEAIERACDLAFPPPAELARQRVPARGGQGEALDPLGDGRGVAEAPRAGEVGRVAEVARRAPLAPSPASPFICDAHPARLRPRGGRRDVG
jgi:integrase